MSLYFTFLTSARPGAKHAHTVTSGRPTWCKAFRDPLTAGWSLRRRFTTNSERSSLLPPRCNQKKQQKNHVQWKTIWKLKATMRGRMTVLQFLVILTVKNQIHHHSLLTLPLNIQWIWKEAAGSKWKRSLRTLSEQRSAVCCSATSQILVFQKMGPLQHLHVALVDFKCGAEADGQTGQYIAALHEQERLPINFLTGGEGERIYKHESPEQF